MRSILRINLGVLKVIIIWILKKFVIRPNSTLNFKLFLNKDLFNYKSTNLRQEFFKELISYF